MVEIDEKSQKGRLTIDLLKEMGFMPLQLPSLKEWGMPSSRKASADEIKALLYEANQSTTLLLADEIEKYKQRKK